METWLIVILSIVGFIAAFFIFLYTMSRRMRIAANKFFEHLGRNEIEQAHEFLGASLSRTIPPSQFRDFLGSKGIVDIQQATKVQDFSIGLMGAGHASAYILCGKRDCVKLTLDLFKQNGAWKIENIAFEVSMLSGVGAAT